MWKWLIFAVLVVLTIIIAVIKPPPAGGKFSRVEIHLTTQGKFMKLDDEKLMFVDAQRVKWVAPIGTLTDGATVPRLALPVTDGRWDKKFLRAAVVHDAYCQKENKNRTKEQYCKKPWQDIHRMFYEACVAGGTELSLAKLMYAAVRWRGPRCNDPDRDLQYLPDDTLMRGFSGAENWIKQNNPSIDQIDAYFDKREPVLLELHKLEIDVSNALERGDNEQATILLQKQQEIVEQELSSSPNDSMLRIFDGHMRKNRGKLYRLQDSNDNADNELIRSEEIFEAILEKEKEDAAALIGLSSVSVLRGDLVRGQELAEKAHAVAPKFEAAKQEALRIQELRNE